ncbi:MAG: hypothetical protein BWY59_01423 [Verrucomicrobia bacterium ADurb.Bin345]|nr:MAG: hypothetical protein BWY59_01423 [Verrucomicrobia bacterium ADurb.Bin345]
MRSFCPLAALKASLSARSVPLNTRTKRSCPTKGSFNARHTSPENGAPADTSSVSPAAFLTGRSAGDGKKRAMLSSSSVTPISARAITANTGTSLPCATALLRPDAISSGVSASPPRYFSINASSDSAAHSISADFRASTASFMSAGTSAPNTSTTFFRSAVGITAGRQRMPHTSCTALTVASKSAFSLSNPVMAMPRGRPSASHRRHARLVPIWMPPVASITNSPASATAVAATICP